MPKKLLVSPGKRVVDRRARETVSCLPAVSARIESLQRHARAWALWLSVALNNLSSSVTAALAGTGGAALPEAGAR